jgi:hypothetical protein
MFERGTPSALALGRPMNATRSTAIDQNSTPTSSPVWELRLALGAVLVAIAAAVTLVPAVQASAASARGDAPAASTTVGAVVQGLQVFTSGPFAGDR